MELNNSSSRPRYLSNTALSSSRRPEVTPCDLITFLSVAQELQIEILPVLWQAVFDPIGGGATGRINEVLINLQTSFALKTVSDERKGREDKGEIINALINEILVLSHPSVRQHRNIVELQAICWDVTADERGDKVWPALVFEKSPYGDLAHFMTSPIGRNLEFADRLKLCVDVGIAISDMHLNAIIHGDIKPENVLVFRDEADKYVARVTDFGYSTPFAGENDLVRMPKSQPWCAPEHDRDRFTPAQARKMDVFSFGMLCFWVLFERCLSGVAPLPEEAHWAKQYLNKSILDDMKRNQKLAQLGKQLVTAEQNINQRTQQVVAHLLCASLACNTNERSDDLKGLLSELGREQQQDPRAVREIINFDVSECEFKIIPLIDSFYRSDFRVRQNIRQLLEDRECVTHDAQVAFQLAICCKIGFGGPRDEGRLVSILEQCKKTQKDLDEALAPRLKADKPHYGSIYAAALGSFGYTGGLSHASNYRSGGKLEEAEKEITRDAANIANLYGKENSTWLYLKSELSQIFGAKGRWKEAEELDIQVMETCETKFEADHRSTLASMNNLAATYWKQGRLQEAEQLYVQVIETCKTKLGADSPETLRSMNNLASTYWKQGRLQEAEQLDVQVLKTRKTELGVCNLDTLSSMNNLASTYRDQGRLQEAEQLEAQVLETRKTKFGVYHPDTLTSMNNLASTYRKQGRLQEAEQLEAQVMEKHEARSRQKQLSFPVASTSK